MSLCHAQTSQLLLIDLQTRLCAAMPALERTKTLKNASILTQAATTLGIPVYYTEQYPRGLGPTEPALMTQLPPAAQRFVKTTFSCCAALDFLPTLERAARRQIVLVGQEAHVCVLQTALELHAAGFMVFVVEDGVCSRKSAHKRNALARMAAADIIVSNVESVLFEWLQDAAHPHFKALSALIR